MDAPHKPLWKTPVMWLVIGLPLASIIAGIALVTIAARSGGADVVRDDVRRVSQIQTVDIGPDARARSLGLSAVLRIADDGLEVIPATGDFARTAPLRLLLQHPSREAEDVELELVPGDTGWRAVHALDTGHDWVVQLAPPDGAWRLHGRLPRAQRAMRLAPSLAQ